MSFHLELLYPELPESTGEKGLSLCQETKAGTVVPWEEVPPGWRVTGKGTGVSTRQAAPAALTDSPLLLSTDRVLALKTLITTPLAHEASLGKKGDDSASVMFQPADRLLCFGLEFLHHLVQHPAQSRIIYSSVPRVMSSWVFNLSTYGDSILSLGNHFQCLSASQ